MNFWMHFRFFWRMVLSVRRLAVYRALLCALLVLVVGIYTVGSSRLSAQTITLVTSKPEFITQQPKSDVLTNTDDYKVSVEFAWNLGSAEPAASLFPVVYWYRNGNYVAKVTSKLKNKTQDVGGRVWYDCWDPYASNGDGVYYPAGFPIGGPNGGSKQIIWVNELPVSLKDPGANQTAVYTAYIPVLDATTIPAQIVLTPAQETGKARPTLNIVRSPDDATLEVGGSVTLWADAQSNVNGLMQNPFGIAVDYRGMVYIADTLNHAIRRITPGGKGRTLVGLDGGILDTTGKTLVATQRYDPTVGTVTGRISVGEKVPSILKLDNLNGIKVGTRLVFQSGSLLTSAGSAGSIPNALTVSNLNLTGGSIATTTAVNASALSGTLTFLVKDNVLPRAVYLERPATSGFSWSDLISIQDPSDTRCYRYQSDLANITSEPLLNSPEALATGDDGSVFIADTANDAIRRAYFDANGKTHLQTISAGSLQMAVVGGTAVLQALNYSNAGISTLANPVVTLTAPRGIVFQGNLSYKASIKDGKKPPVLYVLDFSSIKKFKLNTDEIPGVAPGTCVVSVAYIGNSTQIEGWKSDSEAARLYAPRGMVVTSGINNLGQSGCTIIYIADTINQVVRKFTLDPQYASEETAPPSAWTSEVVAGLVGAKAPAVDAKNNPVYADGGTGFYPPVKLANCTVIDGTCISVPSSSGILAKDVVSLTSGTSVIGSGSYAISQIRGGSLYISGGLPVLSGTYSVTVRRAPSPQNNAARLSFPSGLVADIYGNLYFTEMGSHNVRRIRIDDINPGVGSRVETIAGLGKPGPTDGGTGEGKGTAASFNYPASIAYDMTGDQKSLLVADSANNCVRRLTITTTTYNITGTATLAAPTTITNLGNLTGVSITAGMGVAGLNIPPGAYVVSFDGKSITLNLPVTAPITNTQQIILSKEQFESKTALGYPGVSGNRDFSAECSEYTYQWLKDGKPLANIPTADSKNAVITGVDSAFLSLSNLQTKNSGPYELKITNPFDISADSRQATLYVAPKNPITGGGQTFETDKPAFLSPYYAQLTPTGSAQLTQLRSDQGDMSFSMQAYITPSDAVSYQWQVQLASGTWITLKDSSIERFSNTQYATELAQKMGNDGAGGLALDGTNKANLKISGFQKTLVSKGVKLEPVHFRVKAVALSSGEEITTDQLGNPIGDDGFVVQASYAPVVAKAPLGVQYTKGSTTSTVPLDSSLQQARFPSTAFGDGSVNAGSVTLTLTAQDGIDAFPKERYADPYNPDFRVQYQWMTSNKAPQDPTGNISVVQGGTGDFDPTHSPTLSGIKYNGTPTFFWVRYWTGSGYPEDRYPSVIGDPVNGNYVKLSKEDAVSAGTLSYKVPPAAGEPAVKIEYVNSPAQEFTLGANVDSASGFPEFNWKYLKWGDPKENWKTLVVGTVSAGTLTVNTPTPNVIASGSIWAVTGGVFTAGTLSGGTLTGGTLVGGVYTGGTLTGGSLSASFYTGGTYEVLGQGNMTGSLTDASMAFTSFENMPDLKSGVVPSKDLSGLYCLEASVKENGVTSTTPKFWIVAARQKPVAYGPDSAIYSLQSGTTQAGTLTSISVSPNTSQTVILNADILLPLPDKKSLYDTYGPDSSGNGKLGQYYSPFRTDGKDITSIADRCATQPSDLFRWSKGTMPLVSGNGLALNGSKITISNIQKKDIGTYSLRATNFCGTVTNLGPVSAVAGGGSVSGWSLLSSGLPQVLVTMPTFTASPTAKNTAGVIFGGVAKSGVAVQRVAQGQTVALEIPVESSYALSYSWGSSKDGLGPWNLWSPASLKPKTWDSLSVDSSNSKYLIRSAALQDSGVYGVTVKYYTDKNDKTGTVISGGTLSLNLLVEPMPDPGVPKMEGTALSSAGNTRTVLAGSSPRLCAVSLQTGTSFLKSGTTSFFTYQWKKNGVPLVGQVDSTLQLSSISKSQSGSYSVDVTGVAGTKTSAALILAVATSAGSVEKLYPITMQNAGDMKYTIVPSATKGLPAGTLVSLTGMSSSTKTFLGWKVWDAAGNTWNLPARGAQFVMPANEVTIAPTLGRSSVGMYTGFLSLEPAWGDLEWDIYNLLADPTVRFSKYPSSSFVRGYFSGMITSLGTMTGKVIIEGKTYSFTSPMAMAPDGTYSGQIRIQATLADRTPWVLTGTVSLNMGLVKTGIFEKDSAEVMVTAGAGILENMSVSAYGVPEGTIITSVIDVPSSNQKIIQMSSAATISSGTTGFPVTFGADMAALDNVMHVKLDDVVLELTPPVMKSGQPLYGVAACNAGAYKSLSKFISTKTASVAPATPKFTAGIFRFGIKDASSVFGRGGVLSTSISNMGLATVMGWLPNGSKLTFSGYAGRACFVSDIQAPDPLNLFSAADATGGVDPTGIATMVMQETLERHTASVSVPIWSTSPIGDKLEEPLFGGLLLSDLTVQGCLGVLNAVPVIGSGSVTVSRVNGGTVGTVQISTGTLTAASEYTHNYVKGYLYDPTIPAGWTKPDPFTATAQISISTTAPSSDATTYPLEDLSQNPVGVLGTLTSMGTLGYVGSSFNFKPSRDALPVLYSMNLSLDTVSGLFTGSYVEKTSRYVSTNAMTRETIGPAWASMDGLKTKSLNLSDFRTELSVRFYAATIQGGDDSILGTFGGAAGFLMRGTTRMDTFKNVLGNGYQDAWAPGAKATFRTEALNINVFEPN